MVFLAEFGEVLIQRRAALALKHVLELQRRLQEIVPEPAEQPIFRRTDEFLDLLRGTRNYRRQLGLIHLHVFISAPAMIANRLVQERIAERDRIVAKVRLERLDQGVREPEGLGRFESVDRLKWMLRCASP